MCSKNGDFIIKLYIIESRCLMLNAKLVGKTIQKFRENKNLSQEVLSGLAGIARTHLSAIERGERKPTLETFFKICQAMEIKASIVFAEIEKNLNEDFYE